MNKRLGSGAEAVIYLENQTILKDRVSKSYRIKEIDKPLRQFRTRREAKVLKKLEQIKFPGPRLLKMDDKNMQISMEYIKGDTVKEIFDKNYKKLSEEIGKKVALLHNKEIIHGDLTTSNMIYNKEVYFIDFGLSLFSTKIEDKAVDLHLLKQALESKHWKVFDKAFDLLLKSYFRNVKGAKDIRERFYEVEQRGRYKGKH